MLRLHGPDLGGDQHLVHEDGHAATAVLRLLDTDLFGLGVAREDHRQAVPLELVGDRPFAAVDDGEVSDLHARLLVVVGDAADLAPVELDRDHRISIAPRVVRDSGRRQRQAPFLPDLGRGGVGCDIRGRLEAETLGMPPQRLAEVAAVCIRAVVVQLVRRFRVRHTRRTGSPDVQRREAVRRAAEAVDVRHVAQVIAVQVGEEDLVHPTEADFHRAVVRNDARTAVEDELVLRTFSGRVPADFDEDAHHLLHPSRRRDGRSHEGDAHLVRLERRVVRREEAAPVLVILQPGQLLLEIRIPLPLRFVSWWIAVSFTSKRCAGRAGFEQRSGHSEPSDGRARILQQVSSSQSAGCHVGSLPCR